MISNKLILIENKLMREELSRLLFKGQELIILKRMVMKNKRIIKSSDKEEDEIVEFKREMGCKIAPPSVHRDYSHVTIDSKEKSEKQKKKKELKSK